MNIQEVINYIKEQKKTTIPEVQHKFSLPYSEVRQGFQKLQDEGKIKNKDGLTFEWCLVDSQENDDVDEVFFDDDDENEEFTVEQNTSEDLLQKRRQELMEHLARIAEEEDDEEDYDDDEYDEPNDFFLPAKLDDDSLDLDDDEDETDYDELQQTINQRRKELMDRLNAYTSEAKQESKPSLTTDQIIQAITNKLNVFGIKVEISETLIGASVTRYVFNVLSSNIRLPELKKYADDIKACTASSYGVRIVVPLSHTGQVVIEIANEKRDLVTLDSVLQSEEFRNSKGKLDFVVGTDVNRNNIVADLADMPHLLVAGVAKSGQLAVVNNLIVSIAHKYSPDYVKFLLADPTHIELSAYRGLPHMLTFGPVAFNRDILDAIDYLIKEMENRYLFFKQSGTSNIVDYNKQAAAKLPYIVFVMTSMDKVFESDKAAFEARLMRLTQMSRAAGIHVVLATQRPDTKTVTGKIKANIPGRIALKTETQFDSMTVINCSGCEKLIGEGDMLYGVGYCEPERIQAVDISSDGIDAIVNHLKEKYPRNFDRSVQETIFISCKKESDLPNSRKISGVQVDPLCKRALRFWLEKNKGKASIASIQRNFGIGYNRAGRILYTLQKLGYVEELLSTDPMSKPLNVLVSLYDLNKLFPDLPD